MSDQVKLFAQYKVKRSENCRPDFRDTENWYERAQHEMANEQTFIVFKEYWPYHRILAAFNSDNFHNKPPRQIAKNVLFATCVVALFLALCAVLMLSFWCCMENDFNIDIVSISMPLELSMVQHIFTQISLTTKNDLIRTTLEDLRKTVNERKPCNIL